MIVIFNAYTFPTVGAGLVGGVLIYAISGSGAAATVIGALVAAGVDLYIRFTHEGLWERAYHPRAGGHLWFIPVWGLAAFVALARLSGAGGDSSSDPPRHEATPRQQAPATPGRPGHGPPPLEPLSPARAHDNSPNFGGGNPTHANPWESSGPAGPVTHPSGNPGRTKPMTLEHRRPGTYGP